jgi:mannose/cellobiose epimerase-like protein (N-acyl-D-glucosamine 2-epimerase family)
VHLSTYDSQVFESVQQFKPTIGGYRCVSSVINSLPTPKRWREHLEQELLPFWLLPSALGFHPGDFPTYRANDGSLLNPENLPPEFQNPNRDIVRLNRKYVRSQSRQTYAYGIAYHVTGDEQYLKIARQGVDFLLENSIDRMNGGAYEYFQLENQGKGSPAVYQRTSQSMAYALTGIGFYYYLTRDRLLLSEILAIKKHIFDVYFDRQIDLMRWVIEPSPDRDSPAQKELVAQLDQIFAYMIWLAPALPEPYGSEWMTDLEQIAYIIISQFYGPRHKLFWGSITSIDDERYGSPHTDFGHSVKTFWLLHQLGKLRKNLFLNTFGSSHATQILDAAFIQEDGTWARRPLPKSKVDRDKEWWICAVLDQTAATLSLLDPGYANYLPTTYNCWFEHLVDKEHGEVWHYVDWDTKKPVLKYPKQHSWKTCLHSFEHMLVAYITTHQLRREPLQLYYAFKDTDFPNLEKINPYSFLARVASLTTVSPNQSSNSPKQIVEFTDIR